jgi:hypothetical protein
VAGALSGSHRDPCDRTLIAETTVDRLVPVFNERISGV